MHLKRNPDQMEPVAREEIDFTGLSVYNNPLPGPSGNGFSCAVILTALIGLRFDVTFYENLLTILH